MGADLERTLKGFDEAVAFASKYRFRLTDEYLALIERVEALRRNQSGADKSGRWLGSRSYAGALRARATLLPRKR